MSSSKLNLHKIFVYGTLKKGQPNHGLLQNAENGTSKFLGTGRTLKMWPLIVTTKFNLPFLLDSEGKGKRIFGDIYDVDDRMLKQLDVLENYPQFYDRKEIQVEMVNNSQDSNNKTPNVHSCLIYVLTDFKEQLLNITCIDNYNDDGTYIPARQRPQGFKTYELVNK